MDPVAEQSIECSVKHFRALVESFSIAGVGLVGDKPVAGGGYADVWRGTFRDAQVAVKRLRVNDRTRLHVFLRVRFFSYLYCSLW
jgi:hypothetical protein